MIHNETLNVWSHLIGTLVFLSMVFYVMLFLSPTSLHESTGLTDRWVNDLDSGRFDNLMCDREDF